MDHQILTRHTTFEGKKLSVEEKKTLVKLFLEDQRSSGTTQEEFARKRGNQIVHFWRLGKELPNTRRIGHE